MYPSSFRGLLGVGVLSVFLLAGCGSEKLVPVEGDVAVGVQPLKTGSITLHPDPAKGNNKTFPQPPVGSVSNGKYSIATGGKPGAPLGWYKVTVSASVPSDPKDEYSEPKLLVDKAYTEPSSTSLSFEVKVEAGTGAYDLKLKK